MSNKAKIREEAKKLNPIYDLMFRTMAKDKDFCEEILRVIFSDPKLTDHGEMFENIPVTSGSKCRYKETEEGQQVMCKIMERLVDENIDHHISTSSCF